MAVEKVDHTRTRSNSVREVLTVLGVEAARQSLLHELGSVLGAYGIYVNYRHRSTLCDIMTTRGILTPITRHGINRVDSGALRKCSFEETVEILLEASFHAEVDPLCGVTENIIMGQLAPYGTGCFDLMMDTDMLKDHSHEDTGRPETPSDQGPGDERGNVTPEFLTPAAPDYGDRSIWGPDATQTQYQGTFTQYGTPEPAEPPSPPGGPRLTDAYLPAASPIRPPGGATPYQASGPGRISAAPPGYSPTSPAYHTMGGTTPAYHPTTSPRYQAPSGGGAGGIGAYPSPAGAPGYPPYNQAPHHLPATAGMSPAYQPGIPSGMSPGYRGTMGQSPVYTPGHPAYSPTQPHYAGGDPAYTPGGPGGAGAPGQPDRRGG